MITLEIQALSSQGDGIARHDGVVHFVPRTLPGERCRVRIVREKKKWKRAITLSLENHSPDRVAPECPLYPQCGGCQLQHLNYPAQLVFKKASLAETLKRIGHFDIAPDPVVPSEPLGYREKVTFSILRENSQILLALHQWENPSSLLAVNHCPQLVRELNQCLPELEIWLNREDLQARLEGLKRVILRRFGNRQIVVLLFDSLGTNKPLPESIPLPQGIDALFQGVDRPGSKLYCLRSNNSDPISPSAFRQSNQAIAKQLYEAVAIAVPENTRRIVDAYAGSGELTRMLAHETESVIGIEWDRDTVAEARRLSKAANLENSIHFHRGRTEQLIRKRLPADYVVLDPPRVGCAPPVLDALIEKPARRIAYISCHPAALARDLQKLTKAGYQINQVLPFDMFPQTYHLEVLAILDWKKEE